MFSDYVSITVILNTFSGSFQILRHNSKNKLYKIKNELYWYAFKDVAATLIPLKKHWGHCGYFIDGNGYKLLIYILKYTEF